VNYTTDYQELIADEKIRTVIITTSLNSKQIMDEAGKSDKCISFGIGKDMPEYEIQHMLIEHILPTEAWDKAFQKAKRLWK
jgi:ribonuclease BN (tRNA processing enzyme)